eukprot:4822745-Amphidinium_carterae.1
MQFHGLGGWRDGQLTAGMVSGHLREIIDLEYVSDIITRAEGTAAIQIETPQVDKLLKANGIRHVYSKVHTTDQGDFEHRVLWLPPEAVHSDALETLNTLEHHLGLAISQSGARPRYGIRFANAAQYTTAATQLSGLQKPCFWKT